MAVKISIILAIALSSLLSFNVATISDLIDKACYTAQFPGDCRNSIPKQLGTNVDNADFKAFLNAGLKVLTERAEEGIKEIDKLKPQSQGIDGARLEMIQAYYNLILSRTKTAIEALDGEDYGTLEYELDAAVKTSYECEDLLPRSSPVQKFTSRIHMAAKNNLGFGNHLGSA